MSGQTAPPPRVQAEALHRRAIEALTSGRLSQGISLLEKAVDVYPKFASALNDLGTAYWQRGEPARAERAYSRALKSEPQNPYVLNGYGTFMLEQQRLEEAEKLLTQAFALKPDHYEIPNNLGLLRLRQGRPKEAEGLLLKAIELNPRWPNAYVTLGSVLFKTDRIELAEKATRQAVHLNPQHALAWGQLGEICAALEREDEAFVYIRKSLALDPSVAMSWIRLLDLLEKKAMLDEAEEVLKQAKSRFADVPGIVIAEVKLLRRRGKIAEAAAIAEIYCEHLKGAPALPSIYAFFFEVGQLYDRLNEIDKAFECFTIANGMQRKIEETPGDTEEIRRVMQHCRDTFTPALAQASCAPPLDTRPAPVFLVGFPRSGTTLLDQILSSHPAIAVTEEKPALDKAILHFVKIFGEEYRAALHEEAAKAGRAVWEFKNPCYPAALAQLRPEDIADIRDVFYREHGWPVKEPGKHILVDKLPLNLLFVGFIKHIFPDAKFILALRHPCDSVLSCYMQQFKMNPYMANFLDLNNAARFYDEAFSLWHHYNGLMKLDAHAIHYEDVVADFEPTVKKLLEFLGAGWNDAVLKYDETAKKRNYIKTPSYHQVTEKLYTRASGRWLRYHKHMEPVLGVLAPHALRFGYSMELPEEQK